MAAGVQGDGSGGAGRRQRGCRARAARGRREGGARTGQGCHHRWLSLLCACALCMACASHAPANRQPLPPASFSRPPACAVACVPPPSCPSPPCPRRRARLRVFWADVNGPSLAAPGLAPPCFRPPGRSPPPHRISEPVLSPQSRAGGTEGAAPKRGAAALRGQADRRHGRGRGGHGGLLIWETVSRGVTRCHEG